MGNVVNSFSYDSEDEKVIKLLKVIADRERRSKSFVVMEAIREYVKAHGKANPQYTLDNPSAALPTIWRHVDSDVLMRLPKEDRMEMLKFMEEWYDAIIKSNKARGWN